MTGERATRGEGMTAGAGGAAGVGDAGPGATAGGSPPARSRPVRSTVFVDADVLVYARDASEGDRQLRADEWMLHLWRTRTGRVSYPVLAEYYDFVTRRLDPGLEPAVAREDVRDLFAWRPSGLEPEVLEGAWSLQGHGGLPWRGALTVATAQAAGCRFLLTASLAHGRSFDDLEVVNPFDDPPTRYTVHDGP